MHILLGINKENQCTKNQRKINPTSAGASVCFQIYANYWSLYKTAYSIFYFRTSIIK